jgi:hypothetical protein
MGPARRCGFALVLLAAAADAKPRARIPGTDLTLRVDGFDLLVTRKGQRAIVPQGPRPYPDLLLDLEVTATPSGVTAEIHGNCTGTQTVTLTPDRLAARLEVAAATRLRKAQQWPAAAAGFARALSLDPQLSIAAVGLAVAQARAGQTADAVATLATAGTRDPIWVAWSLASERDLASVASAPALSAFAGSEAAAATLLRTLSHAAFAYSASQHLVAWPRNLGDSMTERSPPDELWILDAPTGALAARLPLRADRRSKVAIARTLAALGFVPDPVPILRAEVDESIALRFPESGLAVSISNDALRVSRDKQVLARVRLGPGDNALSAPATGTKVWAAELPGALLVGYRVEIGDGCGGYGYDEVQWIGIPAPR